MYVVLWRFRPLKERDSEFERAFDPETSPPNSGFPLNQGNDGVGSGNDAGGPLCVRNRITMPSTRTWKKQVSSSIH
jgi:hypothetical protein